MAEKYCDRFILLHEGEVKHKGTLQKIQTETGMVGESLEKIFVGVVKQ